MVDPWLIYIFNSLPAQRGVASGFQTMSSPEGDAQSIAQDCDGE